MRQILGAMRKAINDFNMIQDNDKIAVGVSGGKDSMVLLYALKLYQRFSPQKFDLCGITLSLGFEDFDLSEIRAFCEKIDVEYHVVETKIAEIVFDIRKEQSPCSLCSKMRKGALHDALKELGYNKIALGHHLDDVIETLFLNMLYEGRVSTFKPVTYLDRKEIYNIRPLVYLNEKQIIGAIERNEIPIAKNPCPMDENTKREEMKQMLNTIYKSFPEGRERFLKAITNKENFELWW